MKRPYNHTSELIRLQREVDNLRYENKSIQDSLNTVTKSNSKMISWITDLLKENGYNISNTQIPYAILNPEKLNHIYETYDCARIETVMRIPEIIIRKMSFGNDNRG